LHDDLAVNQSRVFTQQGGDIVVLSTDGNIDAGKGANSSLSTKLPSFKLDSKGNLTINTPPDFSGSGIRASAFIDPKTGKTRRGGDPFLSAPHGIVNAGEAGIGGNNVFISATAVLGANNIQAQSVTGAAPPSSAGLAAAFTGVSNVVANVVKQVADSASLGNESDKSLSGNKSTKLGTLNVEILGFGDGSPDKEKEKEKGKKS